MPTASPATLSFLMTQENLPAVLDVLRHGNQIRRELAVRLSRAFKKSPEQSEAGALDAELSWEEPIFETKNIYFRLDAFLPGTLQKDAQGLKYRIEAGSHYFGTGLMWLSEAKNLEKLRQIKQVKLLQAELNKRTRKSDDGYPDAVWLWWEYWEENIYEDPWSWFASEVNGAKYAERANEFGGLVAQTYALVAEANKALEGRY